MRYLESLPTLATRLRALRKAAGISQKELSVRCGWPDNNARIGHYEAGVREPSTDDIKIIAGALGINPAVLHYGAVALKPASIRIPYFKSLVERNSKGTERVVEIIWPTKLSDAAFALQINDRRNIGFQAGEIIVVDPTIHPVTSDLVVFEDSEDPTAFVIARCDCDIKPRQFSQLNKQSTAISEAEAVTRFVGVCISSIISRRS